MDVFLLKCFCLRCVFFVFWYRGFLRFLVFLFVFCSDFFSVFFFLDFPGFSRVLLGFFLFFSKCFF